MIALCTVATLGLSNAAVVRLNYPTHMMFKSCKLIPVMIGSMIIVGKRYSLYDVLACLCMTMGLIFFTLADSQVQPEFDPLGKHVLSLIAVDRRSSRRSVARVLRVGSGCCDR